MLFSSSSLFPFFPFPIPGGKGGGKVSSRGENSHTPFLSLPPPPPNNVIKKNSAGFVGAESELVAAGGDGGRLFLFDARSSRLRARVRTDSHTCNAFRENPFAPLHLATVGIDDSVKLLAPVGERSGSGGRRGGRGGGGAGEEGGEGGGEGGGGRDSSGSGDEEGEENGNSEGEGDSGEEEGEEELAARLSVEGLESSSLRLMMRLAAMGALPTRRMSLAREVVGQEEGEQEEEEEE